MKKTLCYKCKSPILETEFGGILKVDNKAECFHKRCLLLYLKREAEKDK